jgi:DNA-binding transcriptional ArsR family regulator
MRKELFSLPKGQDVGAAVVVVGERTGNQADQVTGACEIALGMPTRRSGRGVKRPVGRGKTTRRGRRLSTELCQTVAAASHEVRARILSKLLEGPAIYRSLREITKLKPGPLYHHINQLRLAGLIMPKRRDLYELTRGGRNLILALMAMAPLIRDARRRPQSVEESERGR